MHSVIGARRAAAIFSCVASILAVLAIASFFRSFASAHLRLASHDVVVEWQCQALARSLVALLEAEVRRRANVPGPLAMTLRRPLARPDSAWLDLTGMLDLTEAKALIKKEEFGGLAIEGLRAGICRQIPLWQGSQEKVAVLLLCAELRFRGDSRSTARRFELARSIKVSRTGIEPELERFGLFIGDATGLTHPAEANSLASDLALRMARLHRAMIEARDHALGASRRPWDLVLDRAFDPTKQDALVRGLPESDRYAFYGLMAPGAVQDLSRLDLAAGLLSTRAQVERLFARWERAVAGDATHAVAAAGELSATLLEGLWHCWAYQEAYKLLPLDGTPAAKLASATALLLAPDRMERRAQWILTQEPDGPSVQAQLERLLTRPGVTNGVIVVSNDTSPLVLKGDVPGHLMIAAGRGGLVLENVNRTGQKQGRLTVYAHSGPVTLRGESRAVLALGHPADGEPPLVLTFESGAHLQGALIASKLPSGFPGTGTLTRAGGLPILSFLTGPGDPGRAEGGDLFAAVSPRVLYQRVIRP
jgi:hypothetical protein